MTALALPPRLAARPGATRLLALLAAALGGVAIGLAVALGPAPIATVGALAAALVAVGIIRVPELAIPVAVGLLYSNALVIAAQVHGAPVGLALLIPALLALPVLHQVISRGEGIVGGPLLALAGAYLLVLLLATLASRNPVGASEELFRFVTEGLVLYVLLLQGIRSSRMLWGIVAVLLVVGGALGLLSVIQQVTGSFDQTFLGFARSTSEGFAVTTAAGEALQIRVGGPMGEQNRYAQVMLALVPLGVVALRHARSAPVGIAIAILLSLIVAAVALTYSRGAVVAGGLLLVGFLALRLVGWRGLLVALVAIALVVLVVPGMLERVASLEAVGGEGAGDRVISQRLNDMVTAFLVFGEHPVLGVGPGLFSAVYLEFAGEAPALAGAVAYEAHTLYGEVAAETGVFGMLAFFGLIVATMVLLARARGAALRVGRADLADLAAGFLLVIVVHLATGVFLHLSYPRYFWVAMGLAGAAAIVVAREARVIAARRQSAGEPAEQPVELAPVAAPHRRRTHPGEA